MQGAWRVGRVGRLTLYLNYTWIFGMAVMLWWVALTWVPANFGMGIASWVVAIIVAMLFIVSVVLHELAHSVVASTGPRNVNLFPFGAAVPFRWVQIGAGRGVVAALAGPLFSLLLGVVLLWLGSWAASTNNVVEWLGAVATPLGWLNVLLGAVNLLPGIPFDGGWALAGAFSFFSNDREAGRDTALTIGRALSVLLVLAGAWLAVAGRGWPLALGFIVTGWAAYEAGALAQQRTLMRTLLEQLEASDFLEDERATQPLPEDATVADMVRVYYGFPPDIPLPVVDRSGKLTAVTTLRIADTLLQGTWPSTPLRSVAVPVSELSAVTSSTPLVRVLALAEAQAEGASPLAANEDSTPHMPVIDGNTLTGSIDPARLVAFEEAGRRFGVQGLFGSTAESAGYSGAQGAPGALRRLGMLVPALLLLAALVLLGNAALRGDPTDADSALADTNSGASGVTFDSFLPASGSVVGLGAQTMSAQIAGASHVTTATIALDGQALETTLLGDPGSEARTASATAPGMTLGSHTVSVAATLGDGQTKSTQWQFRVVAGAPNPTSPPSSSTGGAGSATQEAADVSGYSPALGARVPAGKDSTTLGLQVHAAQAPQSARVFLDGNKLDSSVKPVEGADNLYGVTATAQAISAGQHRVRVEVTGPSGGTTASEWTFAALVPGPDNAFFKETGYFVTQPFLKYWQENGGLAMFGYPISDLVQEKDQATGETYTAQYFERARFEMHPSVPGKVLLGRLGVKVAQPGPPAQKQAGAQFFPETGHNLSGPFLKYWNENGGLAIFGYPITEAHTEKSSTDGKEYTVQYFERARFELHEDKAGTPFEVQLGLLGTQVYHQLYSQQNTPADRP